MYPQKRLNSTKEKRLKKPSFFHRKTSLILPLFYNKQKKCQVE
ncbi:hypothetical protein BREVNS_1660 [Brevinematales bacterium NS]|nr:hypothetical protein BREVNS_1660 [Brevinematales bacterium NS]